MYDPIFSSPAYANHVRAEDSWAAYADWCEGRDLDPYDPSNEREYERYVEALADDFYAELGEALRAQDEL